MPKSVHPVNNDERCPYHMLEEGFISIGGMTVDKIQHKQEKGDKVLYAVGFPDGKGGHWYEVKGLNHFDNYARNASLLIQVVKKIKEKMGAISAEREQGIRDQADILRKTGLPTVAVTAALSAMFAVKPEEVDRVLSAKTETATPTIA